MNREFEKRSEMVFQALSVLVKIDPRVVFLGGSAIQALLEKPKRLSIDLDISYAGDVKTLIAELEKEGYSVAERKSRDPNFLFFTMNKDEAIVKLDISRSAIPETETHVVGGTRVRIPKKCYFLAAKFSSLAFGTIGRFEAEPTQMIKDIFDIDCLLNLGADLKHMALDWERIVSDQNKLRGANFGEVQCIESIQATLLKCAEIEPLPAFFIPQSALGSFTDSLPQGKIVRAQLATMAARALLLLISMSNEFYWLEKTVSAESKDKKKLDEAEGILVQNALLNPKQVHALKLAAPRALIYLKYWSKKKARGAIASKFTS